MGTKVSISPFGQPVSSSFTTELNNAIDELADEFDNVVYRDGSLSMQGPLNFNSKRLYNLPEPGSLTEPVRLQDLVNYVSDGIVVVPQLSDPFIVQPGELDVVGDGIEDDLVAITAIADSLPIGRPIVFAPGDYRLGSNYTFDRPVTFLGGKIIVPTGVTITIDGTITAGIYQTFELEGTGVVVINPAFTPEGYPEWWGAVGGDGLVNNVPFLEAAVDALRTVVLQPTNYYISETWVINKDYVTVRGVTAYAGAVGQGTNIILNGANTDTQTIVNIGPTGVIASTADLTYQMRVRGFTVARDGPHVPNATEALSATGIAVRGCSNCEFHDLMVVGNNCIGLSIYATVLCRFLGDCLITRSGAALADPNDFFWACYIDGSARIGFAGGNASLTIDNMVLGTGWTGTLAKGSIGLFNDGSITDTYLNHVEVGGGFGKGMRFEGVGITDPTFLSGNSNLHLLRPTVDSFTDMGIEFVELGEYASINVVDAYVAPALGAISCFHHAFSSGNVNIIGGEAICWGNTAAGGDALGLLAQIGSGINVQGLTIIGSERPVGVASFTDFDICVNVNNPTEVAPTNACAEFSSSSRGTIKVNLKGAAAARFPKGVNILNTCSNIEVNCSGLNPTAITGGATNKLHYDGVAVTTNTTSGTGIMSTGVMT